MDFFAGVIDDIAVLKVAISEEDIKNIMAVGLANALAGKMAVSDHDKLSATWASIKLNSYE